MQFSSIIFTSILAAMVSASPAGIDPLTVTSLSPAQISAYASAEASYLESLTADPAFTSLVMELATDSSALAEFTSAAGALATISPSNKGAVSAASSIIAKLPGPAASFYNSVLSEDIAIASSVVNNGATDATSGTTKSAGTTKSSTATGTTSLAAGSTASGSASAASSGSGAAPTNAVVKVAGVAIGIFGAAVAML